MPRKNRWYRVICETMVCEEGPYRSYGMLTRSGTIHDISTDKNFVEEMAAMFNRIDVDPARIGDIIEHMLP